MVDNCHGCLRLRRPMSPTGTVLPDVAKRKRKCLGEWAVGSDYVFFLITLIVLSSAGSAEAKQQFQIMPVDTTVIQGETVILKCVIQNLRGRVQWTKAGFVMGFYRGTLPGHPRYSVVGDESKGEWDLRIENAMLEDDEEYQCQVTPAGDNHALQAIAKLVVAVPPQLPTIGDQTNGSHIEVLPKQTALDLKCESKEGKPGATLQWFKQGLLIQETAKYSKITQPNKLETAESVLTIHPRQEDDGSIYSCQATNPAQITPLESIIILSVLHPPGEPIISGYETGTVVKVGDTIMLKCTSVGGNPPATVIWYRDGKEIDLSYTVGAGKAFNDYQFVVEAGDNNARYSCVAKNFVTTDIHSTSVTMSVQFPPTLTTIKGKTSGISGETLTLTCETANSNPAAVITWLTQGRQLIGDAQTSIPSPDGGFITRSDIAVTLTDSHDGVMYTCQATNVDLQVTKVDSAKLMVLYPPQKPVISGYRPGVKLVAGERIRLTCAAVGGNPLATVTWWKGDTKLDSVTKFVSNIASNELALILDESDNGAEYRCNATNEATAVPLVATVVLTVQFRSNGVSIVATPTVGRAGRDITLTCTSESSNPASTITWWKAGREVKDATGKPVGNEIGVQDARHGGKSTTNVWVMDPKPEDNGVKISCRATNQEIGQYFSDAFPLTVLYPPVVSSPFGTTISIVEGGSQTINLTGHANPNITTYSWSKDGNPFTVEMTEPVFARGSALIINGLRRSHAGVYVCTVENEEGKTDFSLTVDVQFAAEIESITNPVYIDPGKQGKVECVVNGNPIDASMITWSREGFAMASRTSVTTDGRTSTLTLLNMTRADNGAFTCAADNKIGVAATGNAEVIVKYAPEIDRTAKNSKFAAERMTMGHIICRSEGAPEISFSWERNGRKLVNNARYRTDTSQVDARLWLGHLYITNVTNTDYAIYTCTASNTLGQDAAGLNFIGTTQPDPPEDFRFVNATHDTVFLAWNAGFSGGLEQWYRLRYREYGTSQYKFTNVEPVGSRLFGVTGLKLKTRYEFWIMAVNRIGDSELSPISVVAMTASDIPKDSKLAQGDEGPLIIILIVCAAGLVLLGFNVILILCIIRKRKRKQQKQLEEQEHASSKAGESVGGQTVEMYSPQPEYPHPLPDDSRTYSSYDRSLDDFNDDLYKTHYPMDEILPLKNGPYSPSKSEASSLGTDSPHQSLINNKHARRHYVDDAFEAHNTGHRSVTLPRSNTNGINGGVIVSGHRDGEHYRNLRNNAGAPRPHDDITRSQAYHNSLARSSQRYPPQPPVRSTSANPRHSPAPPGPLRPLSPLHHQDPLMDRDPHGARLGTYSRHHEYLC